MTRNTVPLAVGQLPTALSLGQWSLAPSLCSTPSIMAAKSAAADSVIKPACDSCTTTPPKCSKSASYNNRWQPIMTGTCLIMDSKYHSHSTAVAASGTTIGLMTTMPPSWCPRSGARRATTSRRVPPHPPLLLFVTKRVPQALLLLPGEYILQNPEVG